MSGVNVKADAWSSWGHNERPSWTVKKIGVAATAIGIDQEARKNWKVRDCV